MPTCVLSMLCAIALSYAPQCLAERADRDEPFVLEADQLDIDEVKKTQTLKGNVVMTKGTLLLRGERVVVREDEKGFQHGTVYGTPEKPAYYKQKVEGQEAWSEGEALRIEYDTRGDIAQLFNEARLKHDGDEITGEYIWYDSITGKFSAQGKPPSGSGKQSGAAAKGQGRVRVILQPRKRP